MFPRRAGSDQSSQSWGVCMACLVGKVDGIGDKVHTSLLVLTDGGEGEE